MSLHTEPIEIDPDIKKDFHAPLVKPKRRRRTKAEMAEAAKPETDKLTKAEKRRISSEIDALVAKQTNPQDRLVKAIADVVKPAYRTTPPNMMTGKRHIAVKAERADGTLPTSADAWEKALRANGLPYQNFEFDANPEMQQAGMIVVCLP